MAERTLPERKDVSAEDRWDLSPLFASEDAWEAGLAEMKALGERIPALKPKNCLDKAALLECLAFFEKLGMLAERLGEYAHLRQTEDEGDSRSRERLTRFIMLNAAQEAASSWFTPAVQSLPPAEVESWIADPAYGPYAVYLRKLLRWKPHVLSEAEERLMALQSEHARTASEAFSVLTNVDMEFGTVETAEGPMPLSQSTFSRFLQDPDRGVRERAYRSFYAVFDTHKHTLAALYQGSVLTDRFQATARNFPSARAAALFPDAVEEQVYDALVEAVTEKLPALHRYYRLKKKALGLSDFRHWDAYVPMVPGVKVEHSYKEAVEITLEALAPLGRDYVMTLGAGLRSGWVDRYENKGKRSGAFSAGAYRKPPYILLNYKSDVLRDVYTLAHEAGHSMHSHYASLENPFMCYGYSIFEAEVASTFNEELLFDRLWKDSESRELKAYVLNMRVDNVIATIFRQTMFAEYERETHALLEAGNPLSLDALRSTYRKLLEKYFGPEAVLEDVSDLECLRIPHFYRAFYVYKYSTGLAAAMSLARRVLSGGEKEREDYFRFLKAGGSLYPIESLRLAGVDMASSGPVRTALGIFEEDLARLEGLLAP